MDATPSPPSSPEATPPPAPPPLDPFYLSTSTSDSSMPAHNSLNDFHKALKSSRRILALCGAGLSASSGLPTFRGAGGLWRNNDATALATPRAFKADPGLVWLFYGYRRHMSIRAEPNDAHRALAALAREMEDFLCLTQNVDDLSQRAEHPPEKLYQLHGSLFDIKCTACDWIQRGNYDDPFCPALAPASEDPPPGKTLPLLDPYHRIKHVSEEDLPKCPQCKTGLQRPGVVWFNESLDPAIIHNSDAFLMQGRLDMLLVVGTSAQVYPAAGYIDKARDRGARIVVVDPTAEDRDNKFRLEKGDFAFGRDAAQALPELLEPIIGKLQPDGSFKKSKK